MMIQTIRLKKKKSEPLILGPENQAYATKQPGTIKTITARIPIVDNNFKNPTSLRDWKLSIIESVKGGESTSGDLGTCLSPDKRVKKFVGMGSGDNEMISVIQ